MQAQAGFTLLEISIVITIIALVAGAIVTGQNVMENARITAQVKQLTALNIATIDFETRFRAMPGDFNQAISLLGATANGNGNGHITSEDNRTTCNGTYGGEQNDVWEHLSLAGMLEASYDTSATLGIGIPELAVNESASILGCTYSGQLIANMKIARPSLLPNLDNADQDALIMSPQEARKIDDKIDDGAPRAGNFQALDNFCSSATAYATSTVVAAGCRPKYNLGFLD